MKEFFDLKGKYKFEVTDLTALIYTICAVLGIMGANVTVLFFVGSVIATAFCWQAHKINVIVLNVALLALNLVNFIKLFF